jgi:hypothetical protein
VKGRISAASAVSTIDAIRGLFSSIVQGLYRDPPTEASDVGGNAGAVTLTASHLVHVDGGDITTSVGVAQGGKITIDPIFVILQHGGSITSEALLDTGKGGEIQIATDNFLHFPGSRVSAQGRTPELSGTVEIHSPDVNLAGTLAELPTNFLDAASLMRERCAARKSGERSGSFAVRGPGGIPAEPDGWLPAPLLPDAATTTAATAGAPVLVASLSGPLLLYQGCP